LAPSVRKVDERGAQIHKCDARDERETRPSGAAARAEWFVQDALLAAQGDVIDNGTDDGRDQVVIVVHLDLDLVAGVAGGALGRRVRV
jgi:hypothetical protein